MEYINGDIYMCLFIMLVIMQTTIWNSNLVKGDVHGNSDINTSVGSYANVEGQHENREGLHENKEGHKDNRISLHGSQVVGYMGDPDIDPDKPYFDYEQSFNVTGLLGKTAILNCRVKNLGNQTVSWIRHRDIHLLAVGRFTYTSDQRFSASHAPGSEDWLLKIHYLQERDAGKYDCQISTTPPSSHSVFLSVVEPETVIIGGPDVYINTGSRLALTCSVKYSPEPPAFIFWYHDDKLVSYDRTRSGVVVSTEKGVVTTSKLLVQFAEPRHTGVYTCSPANSKPKSVNVHVLAGDKPAAIVHENNNNNNNNNNNSNSAEVTVSVPYLYSFVFSTGLILVHRIML